MVIMSNADSFKQAHELASGDKIALNYGEPFATVVQKITGDNPCPCGFRPPRTDDLEAWQSWYEHLETHKEADDE